MVGINRKIQEKRKLIPAYSDGYFGTWIFLAIFLNPQMYHLWSVYQNLMWNKTIPIYFLTTSGKLQQREYHGLLWGLWLLRSQELARDIRKKLKAVSFQALCEILDETPIYKIDKNGDTLAFVDGVGATAPPSQCRPPSLQWTCSAEPLGSWEHSLKNY